MAGGVVACHLTYLKSLHFIGSTLLDTEPMYALSNPVLSSIVRIILLISLSCNYKHLLNCSFHFWIQLLQKLDGVTLSLLHLDLLLQPVVGSGLLLAHPGLGHPSVLSGIVLWYKRPAAPYL